jgi:thiosulfate/3-mercaptopyruvate sulfurtransferase
MIKTNHCIRLLVVALLITTCASINVARQKRNVSQTRISLVSPEWVAQHATDKGLRVLDVRPNVYDYFVGHVPGAVHLADATFRAPVDGLPVQYLDTETMGKLLSRAGVKRTDRIVLYSDDVDVLGATMIAYILERLGFPEVMLMDGGWSAYKSSQRSVQDYPAYATADLNVFDNPTARATLKDIKTSLRSNSVTIVDARPAKIYRGETNIWVRNGHIPGAINIEWRRLTNADNPHKFKGLDELRNVYEEIGLRRDRDIIVYCGTSREASLEYVVLKHLLGFSRVRLYEGSWAEYAVHTELSVETGARSDQKISVSRSQ